MEKIAPFKSRAQARFLYARHPQMAKKWAKHTASIKALPEKKAMLIEKIAATQGYLKAWQRQVTRKPTKKEEREAAINLIAIPAAGLAGGAATFHIGRIGIARRLKTKTHTEKALRSFVQKVIQGELGGEKLPVVFKAGANSWFVPTEKGIGKIVSVPRMDILAHELGHARQKFRGKLRLGPLAILPREAGASVRALKYIYRYGGRRGLKGLGKTLKGVPTLAFAFATYAGPTIAVMGIMLGSARQIKADLNRIAKEAKKPSKK
jgi:preprotein translocase subunit Sss1